MKSYLNISNIQNCNYIEIEGGDGSGKSTLIQQLDKDIDIPPHIIVREPGQDKFGQQMRNIIMNHPKLDKNMQLTLFTTAMSYTWKQRIKPALRQNKIVLSDRGPISSLIYQGIMNNIGTDKVLKCQSELEVPLPDTIIFLDVAPEEGLRRIKNNHRSTNFFDTKSLTYHQKVYQAYQDILFNHKPILDNLTLQDYYRKHFTPYSHNLLNVIRVTK